MPSVTGKQRFVILYLIGVSWRFCRCRLLVDSLLLAVEQNSSCLFLSPVKLFGVIVTGITLCVSCLARGSVYFR